MNRARVALLGLGIGSLGCATLFAVGLVRASLRERCEPEPYFIPGHSVLTWVPADGGGFTSVSVKVPRRDFELCPGDPLPVGALPARRGR